MTLWRKLLAVAVLLLLGATPRSQEQPQSQAAQNADQLGMTCARVLALPSWDYIAKYVAIDESNLDGQLRGMARYGKCYDARTDSIAAALARARRGPTKAAREDFAAFESALKVFATRALAAVPPVPGTAKEAYANLYEKQFRREFYTQYELKAAPAAKTSGAVANAPGTARASGTAATAAPPSGSKPPAPAPQTADERARSDADPVTQAKNHFGKILNALPEEEMHELHAAFGEVIGPHSLNEPMRLAVYRYAIFLLEPPSAAKPFAPPPF